MTTTATATTPAAPSADAANFFKAVQETVERLFDRWQDEKDYENINDYLGPMQKFATENNVSITQMIKRPFGCKFQVEDGRVYQLKCNRSQLSYKRIA